ncbi:MAG: acetyl-CoA carboxylase biotin carboxyl carrier protein [Acidobacteriota bacterium]
MTLDEIRELIKVVTDTGISELEVQRGDDRVRIRRAVETNTHQAVITAQAEAAAVAAPPAPAAAPAPVEAAADSSLAFVKSPIVGTFYEAAAPGNPPFVQVGDAVKPGQVLCIIESMKLMNEIEAEVAGIIVNRMVANAQPVEYGEALYAVRPS